MAKIFPLKSNPIDMSNTYSLVNFYRNERRVLPTKKTLYGVFDGYGDALRAFRILAVRYNDASSVLNAALYVNVAGVGKMWVSENASFYASKEDYLNGERINFTARNGEYENPTFSIVDALEGQCTIADYCRGHCDARVYAWKDNSVYESIAKVGITYYVAEDCLDVDLYPISQNVEGLQIYATREECLADNELAVCEFEDEYGQKEFEVEVEVIKSIKTTIKAKSADSAVKAAQTAFEGKNIKVFVNGELEYESM